MKHTPIRPSIEQLFAQWKIGESYVQFGEALYDTISDEEKREALTSGIEQARSGMASIRQQVLAQIDATFGPGMGEAVKEMIGG